ncbi:MAG: hypothetical protein CR982_03820 [Candidatus Cloacimonadota bacterium]|nr:MAG: hypothetical protein CR982_03820 [Candidatus Cloacimonadota bacterium]PIE78012.1 MAG: hypothetical protein CSA15_09955 [Candidatus Delongbacteria bacterium]
MYHILWIDDEIDLLKPHILFLEKKGYKVVGINNGSDGIKYVEENSIDIVLLDEMMVGMDGLTVLKNIKLNDSDLPVVMITKSEEESIFTEAIGSRITDFITKPVSAIQVYLTIKKILESNKIIKETLARDYAKEFSYLSGISDYNSETIDFWYDLNERVFKKDIELDKFGNDSLRSSHKVVRNELNISFGKFVQKYYEDWIRGKDSPIMSNTVLDNYIKPSLKSGKKIFFIVIDSLRYDQGLIINEILKEEVDSNLEQYLGVLPTTTSIARNSIFSGKLPSGIDYEFPGFWENFFSNETSLNSREEELLLHYLNNNGLSSKSLEYYKIYRYNEGIKFENKIVRESNSDLVCLVYDILDFMLHSRNKTELLSELINNEKSFRSMIKSWFRNSSLFRIVLEMKKKGYEIIITTDHGNIQVEKFTKTSADHFFTLGSRFRVGRNIKSSNKKQSWQVQVPQRIGLPSIFKGKNLIISKENNSLINELSYEDFINSVKGSYQHGGLSMEEALLPIITIRSN